jgi:hypothetical protein
METGEERIKEGDDYPHEVDTFLFHWLDNNNSCDCNRHLEFLRAGGPGPGEDPHWNNADRECGDTAYRVSWIEFEGKRYDGDWSPEGKGDAP